MFSSWRALVVTAWWQRGASVVTSDRPSQDLSAVLKDLSQPPAVVDGYDAVLGDIVGLLEQARAAAGRSVNAIMTAT